MGPVLAKSMVETSSTDLQRSRMSSAFRYVRSLRVRSSGLRRLVRGPTGNLKTMIELGPKLRKTAVMEVSNPVKMALTPMIVPVPMITPRTVRKARILCVRMVSNARTRPLKKASLVMGLFLGRLFLRAEGLNGIQQGRPPRRVNAEEQ